MRRSRRLFGVVRPLLLLAGTLSATPPCAAEDALKIYVAASTREPVSEVAASFTAETGLAVEVSPGASSKLAKQILDGAPADLFLCADRRGADILADRHLVAKRRNLLGNALVVVVPSDSTSEWKSLDALAGAEVRQIALAIEGVPAGEYGRQALRKAGVWDRVATKVIGGEDVRAVLAFVENGADAGIVYLTDALASSRVRVALEIDPSLHEPIEYPLVLTARAAHQSGALALYDYLGSAKAAEIFRQARFHIAP